MPKLASRGTLKDEATLLIASSKDDLMQMPDEIQDDIGYALQLAQAGDKHDNAKPLKGFKGAGLLEVIARFDGDTYRAVYTVRFELAVYVLHVFQLGQQEPLAYP